MTSVNIIKNEDVTPIYLDDINHEIYKKWENEEQFGNYLLQYNLPETDLLIIRIIEWCGQTQSIAGVMYKNDSQWNERTEISVIFKVEVFFDGIRHGYFVPSQKGYFNYGRYDDLSKCMNRIHEMLTEICHSY